MRACPRNRVSVQHQSPGWPQTATCALCASWAAAAPTWRSTCATSWPGAAADSCSTTRCACVSRRHHQAGRRRDKKMHLEAGAAGLRMRSLGMQHVIHDRVATGSHTNTILIGGSKLACCYCMQPPAWFASRTGYTSRNKQRSASASHSNMQGTFQCAISLRHRHRHRHAACCSCSPGHGTPAVGLTASAAGCATGYHSNSRGRWCR
jgi:hypothetical protein